MALVVKNLSAKARDIRDENTRLPYLTPEKPIYTSRRNRTSHGKSDWFQIGKGVRQGCMLSSCLFNLYVKYIIQYDRLDESEAGIKIAGRNINKLRYADDTTQMAESEEKLKMRIKEESQKPG